MSGSGDPKTLRAAALKYSQEGPRWKVFPVWGMRHGKCGCGQSHISPKDMGKHPLGGHGHKDATTDKDVLDAYWPAIEAGGDSFHNIGLPCDANNLVVIDVDPRNGGLESWVRLDAAIGGFPETLTALTGAWGSERGRHYYFRVPEGTVFHGAIDGYPGIDVKHKGYVLLPPSMHGSGVGYEWTVPGGPFSVMPAVLPEELGKLIRKGVRSGGSGGALGASDTYGVLDWKGKKLDIDAIVSKGIPEGERINTIYPILCALANQYPVASGHGEAAFKQVARVINNRGCRPPLPDDELEFQAQRAVDFVKENPKERMAERQLGPDVLAWVADQSDPVVTSGDDLLKIAAGLGSDGSEGGSLASLGETGVVTPPAGAGAGAGAGGGSPLPPDVDLLPIADGRPFQPRSLTDMGNARRLADHFNGTVRHSEGMGWFIWDEDERRWVPDNSGAQALNKAQSLPSLVARELLIYDASTDHGKAIGKWSQDSRSTARLDAAMKQWKVGPTVRTPVSNWDRNHELLGVKNGVVNLRTGELVEGRPEMGITKRTPAAYERGMRAVQWEQFLDFATGGDKELQSWLQLAAGYTLTGRNDLDVFFIVFGRPGSGKSTFLEALSHVLGEQYSIHLPVAALIDDGRGGSQDEYYRAQLPGMRMAVFSEWPTGKRTKEDAIKQLTGDLTMTGRHPGGQPFTFQSQTKLWLGTNVLPAINDSAMWRRIRAIPFPFVPEVPNPDLKVWLSDPEGGLPAVMSWCVEGAVRILNSSSRDPLGLCEAVRVASAEYQVQEDRMGQFLDEETSVGSGRGVSVAALYEVYKMWAEERGERGMTRLPFEKALKEKGLSITGRGRHAEVDGVSLRPRTVGSTVDGASAGQLKALVDGWQQGS